MATLRRIWQVPYSAVFLSVGTALLLTILLWPLVERVPFMIFWPSVVVSVWQNGTKGGLLATILIAFIMCFVIHPLYIPHPPDANDYTALLIFVLLAGFMSWFVERKKRREVALSTNDQRFRMMMDSVPGGVWAAKQDGSISLANKYWYELNGLEPEDAIGLKWSSVLNTDDLTNTSNTWLKAVDKGQPYELLARTRKDNGQIRWLFNRVVPARNASGQITDWYGTSMDVTDLKETQEALTRERELLQKLIDNVPAMIVMYRRDTSILTMNREFERLTGWGIQEAQGVSLLEALYPDRKYRDEVRANMLAAKAGWRDVQMKTRDGRTLQSTWANIRLIDDTQVSIGVDITARKRSERRTYALQQITAELSRAVTPAEVATVISDQGFKAVGADAGGLMLLTDHDTMMELVYLEGYPEVSKASWGKFPLSSDVPAAVSLRAGKPFWFRSASEYLTHFPQDDEARTIHHFEGRAAVPLVVNERAVGALWLAFSTPQTFDEEERNFIITLAHQSAQAIERAHLYEAERAALARAEYRATRLSHLQQLTSQLSNLLSKEQVARTVADHSFDMVGARAGTIWELTEDGTALQLITEHGAAQLVAQFGNYVPLSLTAPVTDVVKRQQEMWLTLDDYVALYPELNLTLPPLTSTHTWGLLPLLGPGHILGVIGYSFMETRILSDEEKDFMRAIAHQCAQAIERAKLYEAERAAHARAELRASRLTHLQHLTNQLSNAMTQEEVSRIVTERSFQLVGAVRGQIWEMVEDGSGIRLLGTYGQSTASLNIGDHFNWSEFLPGTDSFRVGQEIWRNIDEYAALYPQNVAKVKAITDSQSWGVLPLVESQGITGMIIWSFPGIRTFDDEEKDFLRAIAKQCAQGFERVRLYEQAKVTAAEAERKRLARDLHDSVSQTLFAATVMAESLPKLWQRAPEKALPLLEQMHTLNRAASAEMRVLLSELRPEVLEKTSLQTLYTQLVDAIKGRDAVKITLDMHDERTDVLPPTVHVAFYRIAQETLNNILKHAHARNVTLKLIALDEYIELHISDDGDGFDTAQVSAGLGMGSMRERAENIDADFSITSSPGQGTQVIVRWPKLT